MFFISTMRTVERFRWSKMLGGKSAMSRGRKRFLLLYLLLMMSLPGTQALCAENAAQKNAEISYDQQTRIFCITAADTSYIFGVNERQQLQSIYWGQRLFAADAIAAVQSAGGSSSFDLPINATQQEYVAWGGGLYVTPDVKISFGDGNRDLVLQYVSHQIEGNHLSILLKDVQREVFVTLTYTVDAETGILARCAQVENRTKAALTVEELNAATWNLPAASDYQLDQLTGKWAGEWNLQRSLMHPGKIMMESRRGSTGDEINPWFALERGVAQGEESSDVWFGALGWSGSWQIAIEQDYAHQVRITGGYDGFDSSYRLAPGESLQSPTFYAGFAQHGMGEASRLLHRYELHTLAPQRAHWHPRPVLYNSWEATGFDVDEAGQEALAEKAASIGVERFVMDDGWFGQRNSDHAGLGDWNVNSKKFPHGLKPLIDKVRSLGMDFGLWVEPEMVNADSDLYRAHPDWVLNFPGRPRTEGRNQMVLNLARPEVRDYVYGVLDHLLSSYDIAFLKWDYNRNWSEPGWSSVAMENQKKVYVDYVRNLYGILAQLRAAHPGVEIESCSGGGARVDLGILQLTDEVWPSDNTDPFDRLAIQNGFSYAYAPGLMMSWVTDSPNWVNGRATSLLYRFLSSMQGSLGIGANLKPWTAEDFKTAKTLIAQYKQIRPIVQQGSLFRLIEPNADSPYAVTESVARDKQQAVVFAFLHSSQQGLAYPPVYLRGLDPEASYRIKVLDGSLNGAVPTSASGSFWMHYGLHFNLRGDYQAAALLLEKEGVQ